jgi:hypothetical protein
VEYLKAPYFNLWIRILSFQPQKELLKSRYEYVEMITMNRVDSGTKFNSETMEINKTMSRG